MLQGILNGCGKQGLNAKLSLVSSYCVGVPAAVVLCFALELGVLGLWLGLGLGQFFRCCVGHWLVSCSSFWWLSQWLTRGLWCCQVWKKQDWAELSRAARARTSAHSSPRKR